VVTTCNICFNIKLPEFFSQTICLALYDFHDKHRTLLAGSSVCLSFPQKQIKILITYKSTIIIIMFNIQQDVLTLFKAVDCSDVNIACTLRNFSIVFGATASSGPGPPLS
jgi:hypothetical protein